MKNNWFPTLINYLKLCWHAIECTASDSNQHHFSNIIVCETLLQEKVRTGETSLCDAQCLKTRYQWLLFIDRSFLLTRELDSAYKLTELSQLTLRESSWNMLMETQRKNKYNSIGQFSPTVYGNFGQCLLMQRVLLLWSVEIGN